MNGQDEEVTGLSTGSSKLWCPPGLHAVKFFEDTNPHWPAFGSYESEKDNPAE